MYIILTLPLSLSHFNFFGHLPNVIRIHELMCERQKDPHFTNGQKKLHEILLERQKYSTIVRSPIQS